MIKVYVIAPDVSSGKFFCDVMKKDGIKAEFNYHKIRPRVIENKITVSNDVLTDLNNIFKSFNDKTKSVVIACNTLQLWLDKVDEKYKQNVKIYTTFEACGWKYKKLKTKPLWLGTTPLVLKTTKFPTLLSINENATQDLVQELIWRIKMWYGDDIQTATINVKSDTNNRKIQKSKINIIKNEIIKVLKKHKVKRVILGCTELPMVFKNENESGIKFIDPATVLSEYIKSQSVLIIFAGGTISSLTNNNGTRQGGKFFELLEKLSEKHPGSYNSLNITKSKIIYSGLSENITSKEHQLILEQVNKIADKGITRIIITHGTDSMEQLARFLDNKIKNKLIKTGTVVALTGSNDDVNNTNTDAWNNLKFAINDDVKYDKGGIFVAFHNKFVPANEVVKDVFDGKSMTYISNKSKKYKLNVQKFNKKMFALQNKLLSKFNVKPDNTGIIKYEVNVIRLDHKQFLNKIAVKKPKVVLFKLYHSGTANVTDKNSSVSDLVAKLTKKGIVCFGATENGEPTDLHLYDSSLKLLKSGMIPLYNMYYDVAAYKFSLLPIVREKLSRDKIISLMLKNTVGEIDESLINAKDIKMLCKM